MRCEGCKWPLCSEQCSSIISHTGEECRLISEMGHQVIFEEQTEQEEANKRPAMSQPEEGDLSDKRIPIHTLYRGVKILRALLLPPDDTDYMMQFMGHQEKDEETSPVARLVVQWGKGRWTVDKVRKTSLNQD